MINPLHVHINTIFDKNKCYPKNNENIILYFAHLFNIWLRSNSWILIVILFLSCGHWRPLLCTCTATGGTDTAFGGGVKTVWTWGLGDPPGSSEQTFKTTALHFKCVYF